jgi:hypothetical protein
MIAAVSAAPNGKRAHAGGAHIVGEHGNLGLHSADFAYWPILLKKSKVEPRRKTIDMTSKSEIDSNCLCISI